MLFAIKSSFKFLTLATPKDVDCVMRNERLVTNDVTSGTSQSFTFFFCLLDGRIALPTSICLYFVKENSSPLLKQQLSELEGFCDS